MRHLRTSESRLHLVGRFLCPFHRLHHPSHSLVPSPLHIPVPCTCPCSPVPPEIRAKSTSSTLPPANMYAQSHKRTTTLRNQLSRGGGEHGDLENHESQDGDGDAELAAETTPFFLRPGQNRDETTRRAHVVKSVLYGVQNFYAFMIM